jgi:hypothetical protein
MTKKWRLAGSRMRIGISCPRRQSYHLEIRIRTARPQIARRWTRPACLAGSILPGYMAHVIAILQAVSLQHDETISTAINPFHSHILVTELSFSDCFHTQPPRHRNGLNASSEFPQVVVLDLGINGPHSRLVPLHNTCSWHEAGETFGM